jgi:hypothetical protein
MQVAWSVIGTPAHEGSKTCRRMTAQRVQHRVAADGTRAAALRFTAYGTDELRNVERFKYLGRVLSHDDNDVPAMRRNLKRARGTWTRVAKVLTREEIPAPVAGMFYQAVVAAILLYGSESWVLPPSGLKAIEGFHVEAARRMTGMRPQRRTEGPWAYPHSRDVLAADWMKPMEHYIRKSRARIAKTIEGWPLLTECRGAERRLGSPPRRFWWDQEMNLEEDDDEDDNGGRGGVFPRCFYDETGQEIVPPPTRPRRTPRVTPTQLRHRRAKTRGGTGGGSPGLRRRGARGTTGTRC